MWNPASCATSGAQYGGRKPLSRAFRDRFVEIHVDEPPPDELAQIVKRVGGVPPSLAAKLVEPRALQQLQLVLRHAAQRHLLDRDERARLQVERLVHDAARARPILQVSDCSWSAPMLWSVAERYICAASRKKPQDVGVVG